MKKLVVLALAICLSVEEVIGRSSESSTSEEDGLEVMNDWWRLAGRGLRRCTPFTCCPIANTCCGDYGTNCCIGTQKTTKQTEC